MTWHEQLESNLEFLHEQIAQLEQKITRLANARAACQDCLEAEGLDRLLHVARLEERVLNDLLASQSGEDAGPLEGLILAKAERYKAEARKQAANWRRGQPTPSAYWDAEALQGTLTDLLRRLNAWRAGRPYYAETGAGAGVGANGPRTAAPKPATVNGTGVYPWYPFLRDVRIEEAPAANGHDENGGSLEAFRARLYTALHNARIPDEHIEIVVQPDGLVIATGYAHDDEQAEQALQVMTGFPGVSRVLADIQVVTPARCPACRARAEGHSHIKHGHQYRARPDADSD